MTPGYQKYPWLPAFLSKHDADDGECLCAASAARTSKPGRTFFNIITDGCTRIEALNNRKTGGAFLPNINFNANLERILKC